MVKTSSSKSVLIETKKKHFAGRDLVSESRLEILGSLFIGYLHEQSSFLMKLLSDLTGSITSQHSNKAALRTAYYIEKSLKETKELVNEGKRRFYSVNREIKLCIECLGYNLKSKKIRLVYRGCDCKINGYNNIFRQILICVLLNSVEAFKKSQTDNYIEIKVAKYKAKLVITILDNAGGIDKETLRKIFLPKKSKKKSSTGLGLYFASKAINEYFNGILVVSSNKDVGTSVKLEFKMN